ncbi:structure-specific endonuclease subunit SLX4 [Euwallacea fornicatus]|uniref:structure-specific endonuclease subunit SLX4 n=1 Tax=Euwallacea fornicatus TaxID=995702 RepID=UPI00338EB078
MNQNQNQFSLNSSRTCEHNQSDSTTTQMNRKISKTQTSSKNAKSAKPTTESVSKYFLKNELKNVRYNFTTKTSEKSTLQNVNEVNPQSAHNDSGDDFKSPVLLRRRNNCAWKLNKNPNKPTAKPTNTGSKKKVTKNSTLEIINKNVYGDDTNPEHLQLAIALSKSSFEAEYGHSSKSQENINTPDISVILQNAKPTNLEKFGFKSCRSVLPVSNQKVRSSPLEASKKIKNRYKYITPILSIRTKEDREALIDSKISELLSQSSLKSKAKLDMLPISSTLVNYLPKRRCIFPLDDIYERNSFKINCLKLSNNPARCGCLLKDWSSIPGRDKSPVKQKIIYQKSKYLSTDSISYRVSSSETLDSSMSFKNQNLVRTSCRGLSPDIFGSEEDESFPKNSLDFSEKRMNKDPEEIKNISEEKVEIIDLTNDDTEHPIAREKSSSSLARVASFYNLDEFETDSEIKFCKNDLVNDISVNGKMEIDVPASCNTLINDTHNKIRTTTYIDEELNSSLGCNSGDDGINENVSVDDSFKMKNSQSTPTKSTNDKNSSNCGSDKPDLHYEISPDVELDDDESSHYSYLTHLSPQSVKTIANSPLTHHNSPQNEKQLSNIELDYKSPEPQHFEYNEIITEAVVQTNPKTSFQELEYWDFETQFCDTKKKEKQFCKESLQSPSKEADQDANCIELSDNSFSEDEIDLCLNKSLKCDQKCASSSILEVITEIKTSEDTHSSVTLPFNHEFEVCLDDQTNTSLQEESKVSKNTFCSPAKQNRVSIEISDEVFSNEQQNALNPNKILSPRQVQAPASSLALSLHSNEKFSIYRPSRGYNSADLNVTDYVNDLLSKDYYSFENCDVVADNDCNKGDEYLSWSQDSCIEDEELNYSCYFTTPSTSRQCSEENENDLNDEICAVSEKIEGSAIQNGLTLPSNSPQKIIHTPENYIIKTRNVTPIPDFDSMTTPIIQKELEKVGVKRLKRARGAKLLKYIYESTHPLVGSVDFVEKSGSDDEGKVIKRRKKAHGKVQKIGSVCDVQDSQETSAISNMEVIYSEMDIIGDRLLTDEKYEDLVFERRQSTKIPSCPVPLQIIWYNFLCCNTDIKEKVLLYEPLQLETLHSMLKELGFKFHIQDLLKFLDKKCITIRTARKRAKR